MSEETKAPETNDGTWSGLKKTIIGTIGTAVTAGGVWLSTLFTGGHKEEPKEAPVQQTAPAPAAAPVVINLSNNNTNQQKQQSNTTSNSNSSSNNNSKPEEKPKKSESQDAPW